MADPAPWTERQMLELAARGLGKVAAFTGLRGVTLVSMDEIAAMAGTLAALGLIPIDPFAKPEDVPETLIIPLQKEPTDVRL